MVLLKVEPSESFARSVEVEVSVDIAEESVDALLAQISEKISVKVTELFAWDDDFGEFVLVEKLADVTERAQVTVDAHIHLPSSEVSTGTVAIDPARVKRAAKLGLPEDASDEEIVAAKTKLKRAKVAAALGLPESASDEDIQKAKIAGLKKATRESPSELSELPPAAEAPKPGPTLAPPGATLSPVEQLKSTRATNGEASGVEPEPEKDGAEQESAISSEMAKASSSASKPALRSGEIKVGARSTKEVDVTLRPGERLCWAFHVKDKDIVLSVRAVSRDKDSAGDGWSGNGLVVPAAKLLSTDGHLVGDYLFDPDQVTAEGEHAGAVAADSRIERLTFMWDNHYSKLTAKTVAFHMQICRAGTPPVAAAELLGSDGLETITTDEFAARSADGEVRRDSSRLSFRNSFTGTRVSDSREAGADASPTARPRMGRRASILQAASSAKAMASAAIHDLSGGDVIAWDAPPDLAKQGELNAQWRSDVLPHWLRDKDSKSCRALIAAGVPPEIRPIMWRVAVGNQLGVTRSVYQDAVAKAHEIVLAGESESDSEATSIPSEHDVAVVGGEFGVGGSVEQQELLQVIQAYVLGYQTPSTATTESSGSESGYCQGLPFVGATLLRHTAAFPQLAGFSRVSLENLPFSQLAKIAAAEGISAADIELAMRVGTGQAQAETPTVAGVGKRDMLLQMLTDLLPPEDNGDTHSSQRDTFHAFVLLANIIDPRSGRILLPLMKMEPNAMKILFEFFTTIFAAELPALFEHFESIGMLPQLYLIEWLYTLFAKPLPQCVTAWIWDHIFPYGDRFIFQCALGLLKMLEPHLLLQDDMMSMTQLLKDICQARQQFEGGVYPPKAYASGAMWQGYYKTVLKIQLKDELWEQFVRDLLTGDDGHDDRAE